MRITVWLLFILLATTRHSNAQRYLVNFKDKGSSPYSLSNPSVYLSQAAIERRQRYGIPLDSTDLPVTPRYIDSIRSVAGVTILNASRWLNQVSIRIHPASTTTVLAKINSFPFVRSVPRIASRLANTSDTSGSNKFNEDNSTSSTQQTVNTTANFYNYGQGFDQIHINNGEFLHNIGLRGENMTMSIVDAGFFSYKTLKAFDSVNANGQVLTTWDFVNREASVVEDASHGMEVFSTIAANIPGTFVGTAPKAKFHLFRAEESVTEYPIEEHNLVCAAERSDSSGSQVISSSLGYGIYFTESSFNYTYSDMDGNTTIAAIGADLAARKGILFLNSMGNYGNDPWHYLLTPADGDSVLAVGSVDKNGVPAGSSGYGPSSDGQVKPDAASMGVNATTQKGGGFIGTNNGTSFATPILAGLATCLWQGFPEFNNMKIVDAIRRAGHRYTTPNDRVGYGIPDMRKAFGQLLKEFATSEATVTNCNATLSWTSKDVADMKYEIERKDAGSTEYKKIGEQQGSGAVLASHTYQFTESLADIPSGNVSYRIKQVMDTSLSEYIDTVSVAASCNAESSFFIAPNPAVNNMLIIKSTLEQSIENLSVRIINMQGQTMALIKRNKPAGNFSLDIPIPFLSKGKYFVTIYNNNELLVTKEFIKP